MNFGHFARDQFPSRLLVNRDPRNINNNRGLTLEKLNEQRTRNTKNGGQRIRK